MKLDGKIALVTGAGSGLGRAIATRFAAEGARVVVNDVAKGSAEKTAGEIGGGAVPLVADVADADAVRTMFREVENGLGGLDVLVNNAGIAETAGTEYEKFNRVGEARAAELMSGQGVKTPWNVTVEMSDEAWDRMIRVHLYGTFYCSREAVRIMSARGGGSIVNLSSIAGLSGLEAVPHYCAAKAGILGFTRSLALEVGSQKIRVNAICPGFISTPMTAPFSEIVKQGVLARTPLGRWGEADEIAPTALFLASDDSSFYTGQWLSPNGGIIMQ